MKIREEIQKTHLLNYLEELRSTAVQRLDEERKVLHDASKTQYLGNPDRGRFSGTGFSGFRCGQLCRRFSQLNLTTDKEIVRKRLTYRNLVR